MYIPLQERALLL
jgi:hypothetical protein